MSLELNGKQINEAVGTKDYFRKLNNSTILSGVSSDSEPIDYYGKLNNVCTRIHKIFDEIYSDLNQNIRIIRYIPADNLKNTIKLIMGLYDIGSVVNTNTGNSNKIISILSLSDSRTRPESRASDREIQNAANIIKKGGSVYMSSSERFELVRKAVDYGIKSVASNDPNKLKYLQEVSQGKDEEFLGDVWYAVTYGSNPDKFKGHCGRVICSKEYNDYIEKFVFEKDLPDVYKNNNGDRQYERMLTDGLSRVVSIINDDLTTGINEKCFITNENAKRLKEALYNLSRCKISNSSNLIDKVDKLNKLVAIDDTVDFHSISISGGEMFVKYRRGGYVSLSFKQGDALRILRNNPKACYEMAVVIKKDYENYFNDKINLSDDAMAIEIIFHALPEDIAKAYIKSELKFPVLDDILKRISRSTEVADMGREGGLFSQQTIWDILDAIHFWK